jgi:hypothetical protein
VDDVLEISLPLMRSISYVHRNFHDNYAGLASRLAREDAKVVAGFLHDLSADACEIRGADILRLHDRLSNWIRTTDPAAIRSRTIDGALEDLAGQYLSR